jgi:hypothetical protein
MDKDAFYFPHFSNARNDRKLRRLRKELGVEGYGIYFMILEVLRDQQEFSYPMDDIDLLADEFQTSDQKVRVVVCNYGLFQVNENEFFFSPNFIKYLNPYLERKEQNRINGIKGNLIKYNYATKDELSGMSVDEILALNDNKPAFVGGESGGESQGDRKESKGKEIKESKIKERKEYIPTLSEVQEYFESNGYSSQLGERAFNMYNTSIEDNPSRKYWRDSRDNPIKNWKLKMQSVWFKPENKTNEKGTISHGQSVSDRVDKLFND